MTKDPTTWIGSLSTGSRSGRKAELAPDQAGDLLERDAGVVEVVDELLVAGVRGDLDRPRGIGGVSLTPPIRNPQELSHSRTGREGTEVGLLQPVTSPVVGTDPLGAPNLFEDAQATVA